MIELERDPDVPVTVISYNLALVIVKVAVPDVPTAISI